MRKLRDGEAATILGISRERVSQLARAGKLERCEVCTGIVGVTASSVQKRLREQDGLRAKYAKQTGQ